MVAAPQSSIADSYGQRVGWVICAERCPNQRAVEVWLAKPADMIVDFVAEQRRGRHPHLAEYAREETAAEQRSQILLGLTVSAVKLRGVGCLVLVQNGSRPRYPTKIEETTEELMSGWQENVKGEE